MKVFFIFQILLRVLLFPITNLIMPLFVSRIKNRIMFEMQNTMNRKFLRADVAFEVSSEGELEQVRTLIDYYLQHNKRVELIFSSESVEKKCTELAQNPNLEIFRLPIVTLGRQCVGRWLTAPVLIMCRYDFFPEMMLYGMRKNVKFVLVSASLKNKTLNLYRKLLYGQFDQIICATELDRTKFLQLGIDTSLLHTFDFRVVRILERLSNMNMKLMKLSYWSQFQRLLDLYRIDERVIIGSAWPSELELLQEQSYFDQKLVVVAPHQLRADKIASYRLQIENLGYEVLELKDGISLEPLRKGKRVIMISTPSILCELYAFMGLAIVGGGFHASIHSVLEPYLAGAFVVCGPKVHRSAEYDYVCEQNPAVISIINSADDLAKIVLSTSINHRDYKKELDISLSNVENLAQRILYKND